MVDLRSSTYATFWRPAPEMAKRVVTVHVLHEYGGNPSSPKKFAVHLRNLGWHVELGEPGRNGTPLDVVVSDL